jgi:substrate-binding family protein
MIAALCAAAITLIAAAVIGGRNAEGSTTAGTGLTPSTINTPTTTTGPKAKTTTGPTATTGPKAVGGKVQTPSGPVTVNPGGQRVSQTGATRVGVFKDHFLFGVHTPVTNGGAPWHLSDAIVAGTKGYVTYINRNGGINGLKARVTIKDDQYTTGGARQVGDALAKEIKPFLIEGTLGIDQIHAVALAAHAVGIPYMAGGGPEPEHKSVGMYELYTSYDADMHGLANFICKYGKSYVGETEVRLGTTTLNSGLILPVEKRFVRDLESRKCVHTPVDPKARGTIGKPTDQATYGDELQKFRDSYGGKGVNLIVPLQDPLTTSRQVNENTHYEGVRYHPKWTFVNFAHDGDLEYKLMGGRWIGFRGLSPICYYHPSGGGQPYNPALCAKMGEAHRQFTSLGHVTYDENAGGSEGGPSSYDYQEGNAASDGWVKDGGSGGALGYSIVYSWYGAMKAAGADLTREKFLAALNAYDNYSDLVTGPITYKGSSNHMIGADKFVVLEGTAQQRYRQVTDITPGLVDHF